MDFKKIGSKEYIVVWLSFTFQTLMAISQSRRSKVALKTQPCSHLPKDDRPWKRGWGRPVLLQPPILRPWIFPGTNNYPFPARDPLIVFPLSNARRFFSSKGDPLGSKGLKLNGKSSQSKEFFHLTSRELKDDWRMNTTGKLRYTGE